jgi:hypothetical protein
MNKKYNKAPYKGISRTHVVNLGAYLRKNKRVVMAITEVKSENKTTVYRVKMPPVKRIGKNYIELSELTDFKPEVIMASPEIKRYEVSPQLLKLARLMERIPIATIQRIGRDISDI